ncbi:MAG: peptidoglycan DD-metalloendopeptidase family protein [Gammaproteobacteria bacterium]|nr:peptidoglycan DD-metalloendopeptidase family protein [Gammaproteobacteria bacterium]MDH5304836.1 peptidoglycan DD-metalloendopeptidase family protein [Gammaproteobacteria bacterium]MDH5322458.1 peptidoglycan DD-metalloendopeptidase family protein [Gammaproteobacteria bacterium]
MQRSSSPLLRDYKPTAAKSPRKSKALQWFVAGLGIPLLGLTLTSMLEISRDDPVVMPPTPEMTAIPSASDTHYDDLSGTGSAAYVPSPVPLVLAPDPEYQTLTLKISSGDTLDKLFRSNHLDLGDLATVARLDVAKSQFRKLKPGDVFEITHDEGRLIKMYSALNLTSALQIEQSENGYTANVIDRPIETRKRMAYGVIDTSLFESGAAAGLSDKLIMNIAGIFAWDVDFVLDIRAGDNYYVQWEEVWQDGEFVTDGEIIVAEFNNNGRSNRAIRFIDESGRTDYFTPDGHSVRKAFIRAPVDFTRISSNFNPSRRHPILNTIRAHKGVDYAAPRGTPIKAAGDGKVIFRGVRNGYGNAVILQHGGNITTLYAHMSKFDSKASLGARVRQGQTIGYVGATGLATANHLHYEYRINGVHRNPRTVDLPQASPIADKYRPQFLSASAVILEELEQFKSTQLASVALAAP